LTDKEEDLTLALEKIKAFEDGTGNDFSDVETVYSIVKPLLEKHLWLEQQVGDRFKIEFDPETGLLVEEKRGTRE